MDNPDSKWSGIVCVGFMILYTLFLATIGYLIVSQFVPSKLVSVVCGELFATIIMLWAKNKGDEIDKRDA